MVDTSTILIFYLWVNRNEQLNLEMWLLYMMTKSETFLLCLPILRAIFRAWTQRAQVMPVEDSVIVPILPDDGQRV